MAEETSSLAEVALTPESEHEWELLRELVDFADRLVVAFIFADRFAVRVLRARMEREARERDMPFRLLTCDTADALRQDALAAILSPAAEHEITWLEAFGSEAELRGAWFFAAQRWNEHREPLRRGTLRALIVAAPIWAKPVIRLAAPDLWSITNLVIEPAALPLAATLELSKPAVRHEGTPAERALAARVIEEVLASTEGERNSWALIDAVDEAVRAGAWQAADRAADSLDLSAEALARLANDRDLAGHRPDAFRAEIAKSLTSLGNNLSALGRFEDALNATLRAVELYRELAGEHPDVFLFSLAASLNDLGDRLSDLGHHNEALEPTREAMNIFLNLSRVGATKVSLYAARSLNNLSKRFAELGNYEDAINAVRRAVEFYQGMAPEQSVSTPRDLATSLNNLGIGLTLVGRHEDALDAASKGIDIFRHLARDRPGPFLPDLAMGLNNLGNILGALGRHEEALAATEEAVAITVELAALKPKIFRPELEAYTNNLIKALAKAHRAPEASAALRDAQALLAAARSEPESDVE